MFANGYRYRAPILERQRPHRFALQYFGGKVTFTLAADGRGGTDLELTHEGVGAAYVSYVWALEHGGHSGWLEELYVEPAHRGTGLGTTLLDAVLAQCAADGCAALDLEIDADHERVRPLYRRRGFAELPRRRMVKRLLSRP